LILGLLLPLTLAGPVVPEEFEFRLVDAAGKPVDWIKEEVKYQYMSGRFSPSFKAGVPLGRSLLLGMFLLDNDAGKITPLTPGIQVDGRVIRVDVEPISRSLYCAQALTWADRALYVAETRSIDGSNRYVHKFVHGKIVSENFVTVASPRAIAVSPTTLFVLGENEPAAFGLTDHAKRYGVPIDFGPAVTQMALVKARLYVGDSAAACVRVFNAADGRPVTQFRGEGKDKLTCPAKSYAGIGVAAVEAHDRDYGYTPEVWKFSDDGKPLVRLVRVYRSGPQPQPGSRLEYFGGILGKLSTPGGIAFDDDGCLYVSDHNRWLRGKGEFFAAEIESDGGVVKFSPEGDMVARLGSRFGDGTLIKRHLAQRAGRPPLKRTAAALRAGKELRLLAWGDSITQCGSDWNGGATRTERNWCPVLSRTLEKRYPPVKVRDEANGVGGQTAAEGLCRDPATNAAMRSIDLTLLEFGTNDAGYKHYRPKRYAQALRDMVASVGLLSDSDIVIVTVGPLLDQHALASEEEYIQAAIDVGRELNVPVVNISAAVNRNLTAERLPFEKLHLGPTNVHPNDAGHAVWAQAVMDVLARELAGVR
jgi:lysophospholipase L1-like esterase